MTDIVLKRQLITDAVGNPVGVILPLEEYAAVAEILERHFPSAETKEKDEQEKKPARTSIREAAWFGIWADREDLQGLTSHNWLNTLRQE